MSDPDAGAEPTVTEVFIHNLIYLEEQRMYKEYNEQLMRTVQSVAEASGLSTAAAAAAARGLQTLSKLFFIDQLIANYGMGDM